VRVGRGRELVREKPGLRVILAADPKSLTITTLVVG
jgi:hypothetical protein